MYELSTVFNIEKVCSVQLILFSSSMAYVRDEPVSNRLSGDWCLGLRVFPFPTVGSIGCPDCGDALL
jgi:hypothetical protein